MNTTRNKNRSEDAKLLAQFVSDGDEAAFARLVEKYERLVWNICCRILDHRCDAEDAFQATFCLLATKARRIRKPKSLSSWLYGVAFRTASTIRRQRHRDMIPLEESLESIDASLQKDVLEYVAQKNENEMVSAELMSLKEKYRTPLIMFYFQGDSTSQIAHTLGLTIAAAESRLRQARRVMKNQLRIRGINWSKSSVALVIPVLVITPSLASTTTSSIVAASATNGLSSLLANLMQTLNHAGAKLMLCKAVVSIGIVCVASLGASHTFVASQGDQITVVQENGSEDNSLPVKFVQEEDESQPTPNPIVQIHNHIWETWKRSTEYFFPKEEDKVIELILEERVDDIEDQHRAFLRLNAPAHKTDRVITFRTFDPVTGEKMTEEFIVTITEQTNAPEKLPQQTDELLLHQQIQRSEMEFEFLPENTWVESSLPPGTATKRAEFTLPPMLQQSADDAAAESSKDD